MFKFNFLSVTSELYASWQKVLVLKVLFFFFQLTYSEDLLRRVSSLFALMSAVCVMSVLKGFM